MQTTLNVLALVCGEKTRSDLTGYLGAIAGLSATVKVQDSVTHFPEGEALPDVLLYEVVAPTLAELTALEKFIAEFHDKLVVLAIGSTTDTELLRRLMRAGVRDVLPSPLVRKELLTACAGLYADKRDKVAAQQSGRHAVCVFMDAKGGSGATTIAVNVAALLASERKIKTCLMDFDIGFGSCAHMLDIKPNSFLTEALHQSEQLDGAMLKSLMTEHASGLHVLASPAHPTAMPEKLSLSAIRKIIDIAADIYDVVVIDMPRETAAWAMEVTRASTKTMVVMQNALTTIQDVKLLLEYMPHAGVDMRKVELVNNRAMAKSQSVPIDQIKQMLGRERIHRVRNDYHTARLAADQGLPIYKVSSTSDLTEDIRHLANDLWHSHEPDRKGYQDLLSRWFMPRKDAS
jgi:pilus assembly protein CpaE